MAPVPTESIVRYGPLAVVGSHMALVGYFTYAVVASLYTSYTWLSPAQDTRKRQSQRTRLVPAFLGLAVVAFAVASYWSLEYAALSYEVWAHEHGLQPAGPVVGPLGLFPQANNSSQLHIAQWLSDTSVYLDALEIIAEKSRRFWWGQQINLATVSWSMLLAIEGKRRRIPLLTAFLSLAHLVNLSFAQNLFYLALLLTPAPLADGDELVLPVLPSRLEDIRARLLPPKPPHWVGHPALFIGSLVVNFAAIYVLPYAAETPSFTKAIVVARGAAFLPLLIPKIVPVSWGKVHRNSHEAYNSVTRVFRFLTLGGLVLHGKASIASLLYNTPDSHYHRHSHLIPWDVERRSAWERSTTALGKVLGATSDHPVVAAVGWDALISLVSLGLWAAVRATDVQDMMMSMIPLYPKPASQTTHMHGTAQRKATTVEDETDEDPVPEQPRTLRRSGRPHKLVTDEVAAPTPTTRKRGRASKRKQVEEDEAYEPSPAVAREIGEGDILPEDLDWEPAALTWGLAVTAGLGCASAGVFGGECISR